MKEYIHIYGLADIPCTAITTLLPAADARPMSRPANPGHDFDASVQLADDNGMSHLSLCRWRRHQG